MRTSWLQTGLNARLRGHSSDHPHGGGEDTGAAENGRTENSGITTPLGNTDNRDTDNREDTELKVWDLHSDTLSELRYAENDEQRDNISFLRNNLHIDLERLKEGDYLLQCLACFVHLGREEKSPLAACLEMVDRFHRLLLEYPEDLMWVKSPADIELLPGSGKIGVMLTVEEGGVCLDDVRMLRNLYRLGVRMMTLGWNFDNGLGSPNLPYGAKSDVWPPQPETEKGLTQKGLEFVEAMNDMHMIIDVSHLSDAGFMDVARTSKMPFAASHSNARAICPHPRNLTDEMIRTMGEKGCLIGLNYYGAFLDPTPDRSQVTSRISDMIIHARHIMDVGGEDILALGSDFDGIDGELELKGAQDMPKLAQGMEQAGFSQELIEKIFYKNAMRFFKENL